MPCHEDGGHIGHACPRRDEELYPRDPRHDDIRQQEVDRFLFEDLQRGLARVGQARLEPQALHEAVAEPGDARLVIYDEDAMRHGR